MEVVIDHTSDDFGPYTKVWQCEPPPVGTKYRVISDEVVGLDHPHHLGMGAGPMTARERRLSAAADEYADAWLAHLPPHLSLRAAFLAGAEWVQPREPMPPGWQECPDCGHSRSRHYCIEPYDGTTCTLCQCKRLAVPA